MQDVKNKTGFLFEDQRGFKQYITEIINSPQQYELHSLRSRAALAATNNGILDRLTSKQERWSLKKVLNDYINDSDETKLSISSILEL